MSVLKEQPYVPLDEKELKAVMKALKKGAPELTARVISQLKQQEHYLKLQQAYRDKLFTRSSDMLRDIADEMEQLEDIKSEHENCE